MPAAAETPSRASPTPSSPAADTYRAQAGSPAVDSGALTGVMDDFDGHPRPLGFGPDIGAFELDPGWDVRRVYLPASMR